MKNNGKTLFNYVISFSKLITIVWLFVWVETIIFSQIATVFNFGDVLAIQYINDNVVDIGLIICGFYFSTKCLENIARGVEQNIDFGAKLTQRSRGRHSKSESTECDTFIDGPLDDYQGE